MDSVSLYVNKLWFLGCNDAMVVKVAKFYLHYVIQTGSSYYRPVAYT